MQINVFLSSQELQGKIVVTQSPLRPAQRPYEHFSDEADTTVRIKPQQVLLGGR